MTFSQPVGDDYVPIVPGDETPPLSRFDFRHLSRLHQLGLLKRLPLELGPFPSFSFGPHIDEDLLEWNIVEPGGGRLTPAAGELIRGVDDWDTAVWGTAILRDYRVNVDLDLPEEFLQFGVDKAIRTTPRVTFMITRRDTLVTTVVASSGFLDISGEYADTDVDAQMGRILHDILDPRRRWGPYPLPETVTLPLKTAASAASELIDPDGLDAADIALLQDSGVPSDEIEDRKLQAASKAREKLAEETEATEDILLGSGVSTFGTAVLTGLMSVHESAMAQVCASIRMSTDTVTGDAASTVVFFDDGKDRRGAVVSYPGFEYSEQLWVTYVPGTDDAYVSAVKGVIDITHRKTESTGRV